MNSGGDFDPAGEPDVDSVSCGGIPFTISMVSLLLFPATFFLFLPFLATPLSAIAISVGLITASAVTSAILFGRSEWPGLGKRLDGARAARLGALVGLGVFLLGGSMELLATTLRVLVFVSDLSEASGSLASGLGLASIVLTLVPAVAAGSLVSLLATQDRGSDTEAIGDCSPNLPPDIASMIRNVLVVGVVLFPLSVFSLAVPSKYLARSESSSQQDDPNKIAPAGISGSQSDDTEPLPPDLGSGSDDQTGDKPAEPSFSYSTPEGLSLAPPWQWRVVSVREIPKVDHDGPVAFSPNGRYFAHRQAAASSVLSIHDLESSGEMEVGHSLPPILDFAWSPDSARIICLCDSGHSMFWIVDVSSGLCTLLPVPFGTWKVKGRPWWWSDDEIGFAEGHKVTSYLDLDTLRLGVPEESDYWKPKAEATGATAHTPPLELSGTERCRLAILPRIGSYTPPSEERSGRWAFTMTPTLAAIDKKTGVSRHLLPKQLFVQERTKLLSASDGSKVAMFTGQGAVVLYFGIEDIGAKGLGADLPPISSLSVEPRFQSLIGTGRLAAFVCAPLVNPLNQAVVGPDRQRVKGVARVLEWTEENAEFELVEQYSEATEGDVITDLHTWRAGATSLIDAPPLRDWWTTIELLEPSEREGSETRPERWVEARLSPTTAGLEFTGWPRASVGASPPILSFASSLSERDKPAHDSDRTEPSQAESIRKFVRGHHRVISEGDMTRFAANYAERVDFFDRGIISRADILNDQVQYRQKYKSLTESVFGEITVTPHGELHRVAYGMRSTGVRLDDSTFNTAIEVTLDIQDRDGTLEIVRQRARVSDRE